MGGPRLLSDMLAVVVLVTSGYCFSRLVVARLWHRSMHYDVNMAHVAMGTAMAGMFVTSLRTLPASLWEVLFSCLMAWFALRVIAFVRRSGLSGWDGDRVHQVSHYATHFVMALAMLYVLLLVGVSAPASASGAVRTGLASVRTGAMSGTEGRPALALLLLVALLVSAVWHADGLARFSPAWRSQPGGPGCNQAVAGDAGPLSRPGPPAANGRRVGPDHLLAQPALVAGATLSTSLEGRPRGAVVACGRDVPLLAPRLEIGCHVAMCIAMGYMLLTMR